MADWAEQQPDDEVIDQDEVRQGASDEGKPLIPTIDEPDDE